MNTRLTPTLPQNKNGQTTSQIISSTHTSYTSKYGNDTTRKESSSLICLENLVLTILKKMQFNDFTKKIMYSESVQLVLRKHESLIFKNYSIIYKTDLLRKRYRQNLIKFNAQS
jgi:hypothetical protein